jgi:hypothetical protein
MPFSTGSAIADAAASTPGKPSMRRTTWVEKFSTLAVVPYAPPAKEV